MKIILCSFLLLSGLTLIRAEVPASEPTTATKPATSTTATGKTATVPTVVTSDQFKLDMQSKEGVFTGNVLMVGADFKMKSRELFVYFDDKNQVKRMISRGDVQIDQPDRQSKSGQAEYFTGENKIILTETPQVVQTKNTVTGTTITIYRDNNKMDVDGHSRVLIYEDNDTSKPSTTPAQ